MARGRGKLVAILATIFTAIPVETFAAEALLQLDIEHVEWPDDYLLAGARIVVHGATFHLDNGQTGADGHVIGFYPGLGTFLGFVDNDPRRQTGELILHYFQAGGPPPVGKADQIVYLETPLRLDTYESPATAAEHESDCPVFAEGEFALMPLALFYSSDEPPRREPLPKQCVRP